VNGQNGLHGGMMMTFADYALFMIARDHLGDQSAVTVSFNADFCSRGELGDFVETVGEVVHTTRKMLFIRGTVFTGDRIILRYSGVLKKIGPRKTPMPEV
jgi:acyl-coenzyme A thioesterase PaaI-like protein